MSVTFAPRARIAVNASWPGVSRKVIFRPSTSVWYAPMCCVIPPASVSTTAVSRIASSSVVLPWSTWPMIVTTGGRASSDSSRVVVRLRLGLLVAGVLDRDLALELGRDQLDLVVGERLRRGLHLAEAHQHLDDLRHRDPERLREVAHGDARLDGDRPGRRRRPRAASWAPRSTGRSPGRWRWPAPGRAAAALDHDAALPVARAAASSWSDRSTAWH